MVDDDPETNSDEDQTANERVNESGNRTFNDVTVKENSNGS